MTDKLFNGTVITPEAVLEDGWVLVADGLVQQVGTGPKPTGERIGDSGCLICPGAIDAQVHSRSQKNREDFIWSTSSAAAGGVTTIVDMPYDDGSLIASSAAFEAKRKEAEGQARVDFALYATVDPKEGAKRIPELVEAGACAFKFSTFGTHPTRFPRLSPPLLQECFAEIGRHGLVAGIHNEDDETVRAFSEKVVASGDRSWAAHGKSRPPIAEALAMAQVYEIGVEAKCPVHVVHCSMGRGYELALAYRNGGHQSTAEACLHYLVLSEEEDVRRLGGLAKVNPPIRTSEEREAIWRHLAAGNVEVVSTDHVSWSIDRKNDPDILSNSSGVPALELLYPLLLDGLESRGMPLTHAARLLARNPSRLFRIDHAKGALDVGRDADIAIFRKQERRYDPRASGANVSDWSPYEGMRVGHRIQETYLRGEAVFTNGTVVAEPGTGRFQRPSSEAQRSRRAL